MKALFKLVWLHPSPPVALTQLYAESRLSDNHFAVDVSKKCLFLAFKLFLDSFTMRETNGRRVEEVRMT